MIRRIGIFFPTIILLLAACTKSGGGGSGGNGGKEPEKKPTNREEALQKLSPEHRANFETWVSNVVKACDSSQAFGLNNDRLITENGIDGSVFLKKTNGSVVFSDGKSFAIINNYNTFSGTSTTKSEETSDINGKGYTISAEAKREGSKCALYLFDQKIYETEIFESFVIGSEFAPGKEATSNSPIPTVRTLGINGSAEVVQHGFFSLLSQTLRPTNDSRLFVGQILGFTNEQSESLLKLNNYFSAADAAVRIDGNPTSVWSNQDGNNLISQFSILKEIFDGNLKTISLEIRLPIPHFDFAGVKNTADSGTFKLIAHASLVKNDQRFLYSLKGLENNGLTVLNQTEAETCAKDRLNAYLGSVAQLNAISPSVQLLLNPCKTLFSEIEETSYKNGFFKSLIPVLFALVTPSNQFQYGGWDSVLSRLVKEILAENKDIFAELDPSNKTKIISSIFKHLGPIRIGFEEFKNLEQLKEAIYQMGLDWSFKGMDVSATKINLILQTVDHIAIVFKASSEQLLHNLAQNPNSDQLVFAMGIDDKYINEAVNALNLSKELNYTLFETDVFNQIIQKKVTLEELQSFNNQFSIIKSEVSKYSSLTPVKGDLVRLSLKWLKKGEVTQQELSNIYSAINNTLDSFKESTQQLIRDLDQSLAGNKEALEYARGFSDTYKQIVNSIVINSKAAEYESWGQNFLNSLLQKRPSFSQIDQWNEMWNAILTFIKNEKALVAGDSGAFPEWNRKDVIEVAIKESWSAQNFISFVVIASVATGKNTCEQYKDASSQAKCVGLGSFSKGQKKFFDTTYADRYRNLAIDFNGYLSKLSDSDWTSFKWTLVEGFFGTWEPIWSKCDNNIFTQKANTLKNQMTAIISESDTFKKWDLERQIKETLNNCN